MPEAEPPPLRPGQLLALNAYWLAINLLWTALGVGLLPVLVIATVCRGDPVCPDPIPLLPGFAPGKGVAEAIIVNAGLLVSILVQPTVAALSDHVRSPLGARKPFLLAGTLLDLVFLAGLFVAGSWWAILGWYLLLQLGSNLAQGPFQALLPALVPGRQLGLASGLMGLMLMLGAGGGALLVALAAALGEPRLALVAIAGVELVAMTATLRGVPDGPQGRRRDGRSWATIARATWGTDLLADRDYAWLLASRLFLLMTAGTVTAVGFFFMQDSLRLAQGEALAATSGAGAVIVVAGVVASLPAGRLAARLGRKRTIGISAVAGAAGMAALAGAPTLPLALAAVVPIGLGAGAFLAVDWALLAAIAPRDALGRSMGLSVVVSSGSGILAAGVGLLLVDAGNAVLGYGTGARVALALAVTYYAVGVALLARVREPGAGAPVSPGARDASAAAVEASAGTQSLNASAPGSLAVVTSARKVSSPSPGSRQTTR